MNEVGYLILAISILVVLLATFIISFVAYRKTPVPKRCENLKFNESICAGCTHTECSFYQKKEESEQ